MYAAVLRDRIKSLARPSLFVRLSVHADQQPRGSWVKKYKRSRRLQFFDKYYKFWTKFQQISNRENFGCSNFCS